MYCDTHRKRYALKVLPAPEPSDVLWENLECTRWQRTGRRIIIAILNLVIITIGKHIRHVADLTGKLCYTATHGLFLSSGYEQQNEGMLM